MCSTRSPSCYGRGVDGWFCTEHRQAPTIGSVGVGPGHVAPSIRREQPRVPYRSGRAVQITKTQVAGLLKQTKIGPSVDFDVLLMALVHEFMVGECPCQPWAAPRRITDGRLPSLTNLGGAALSRTGITASGALPACCAVSLLHVCSRAREVLCQSASPVAILRGGSIRHWHGPWQFVLQARLLEHEELF